MNTNNDKETPDYGEPWAIDPTGGFWNKVVSAEGKCVSGVRPTRRAIQCVNACAGMADPAAELAAMREAIKEAHCLLKWTVDSSCGRHHVGVSDALAKLQPFIK